jgi:hypothetical protein
MTTEIWLKPNHRAIALGFLVPGLFLLIAVPLFTFLPSAGAMFWIRWCLAAPLIACSVVLAASLIYHLRQPRLASDGQVLLVYLAGGVPYRVPLEQVECFFLGQTQFGDGPQSGVDAKNIVVRLAERAEDWHHREVRRNLGNWCGGYITVKGGWCEPITDELMRELNRRLIQKHAELKTAG